MLIQTPGCLSQGILYPTGSRIKIFYPLQPIGSASAIFVVSEHFEILCKQNLLIINSCDLQILEISLFVLEDLSVHCLHQFIFLPIRRWILCFIPNICCSLLEYILVFTQVHYSSKQSHPQCITATSNCSLNGSRSWCIWLINAMNALNVQINMFCSKQPISFQYITKRNQGMNNFTKRLQGVDDLIVGRRVSLFVMYSSISIFIPF